MVLRLDAQVLEDGIRPEPLHMIPVLDLTMANRVVDRISGTVGRCQSFIANEEVQVLGATLRGQVGTCPTTTSQEGRLVRNGGSARARGSRSSGTSLGRNGRGEDERGGVVTGETCDLSAWSFTGAPLGCGQGPTELGISSSAAWRKPQLVTATVRGDSVANDILVHDNGRGLGGHDG